MIEITRVARAAATTNGIITRKPPAPGSRGSRRPANSLLSGLGRGFTAWATSSSSEGADGVKTSPPGTASTGPCSRTASFSSAGPSSSSPGSSSIKLRSGAGLALRPLALPALFLPERRRPSFLLCSIPSSSSTFSLLPFPDILLYIAFHLSVRCSLCGCDTGFRHRGSRLLETRLIHFGNQARLAPRLFLGHTQALLARSCPDAPLLHNPDERVHHLGVILHTLPPYDLGRGAVRIHRLPVRGGTLHCVKSVRHRQDARAQWDGIPREAIDVAASVHRLVVMRDRGYHRRKGILFRDYLSAYERVLLDLVELLGSEYTRLVDECGVKGKLADIVEQRRLAEIVNILFLEVHLFRYRDHYVRHPEAVPLAEHPATLHSLHDGKRSIVADVTHLRVPCINDPYPCLLYTSDAADDPPCV